MTPGRYESSDFSSISATLTQAEIDLCAPAGWLLDGGEVLPLVPSGRATIRIREGVYDEWEGEEGDENVQRENT